MKATSNWLLGCLAAGAIVSPGGTAAASVSAVGVGAATAIVGQATPGDSEARRQADVLLRQARDAMQRRDFAQADRLLRQAEQTGAFYDPLKVRWEDSPARARQDLAALTGGGDAGAKQQAQRYLENARAALQQGDKQRALDWYRQAATLKADFRPGEFSPLMMALELRSAGIDPAQLAVAPPTAGPAEPNYSPAGNAPPNAAQPNRLPPVAGEPRFAGGPAPPPPFAPNVGAGAPPTAAQPQPYDPLAARKSEALRLLAQARAALDRGDVWIAERLVRQAEDQRVPDNSFSANETRPWEMRILVDQAIARRGGNNTAGGVQPASAVQPAGGAAPAGQPFPVAQGLYDADRDPTRVAPAGFERNMEGVRPAANQQPFDFTPYGDNPAAIGANLYTAGLEALGQQDRDRALTLFRQSWRFESHLDPIVRQQVKDKIAQLSASQLPAERLPPAVREPAPLPAADAQQQNLRQRLFSEITAEQSAAEQQRERDPRGALARLEALRGRIADHPELNAQSRGQLLTIVERSVADHRSYVDRNLPQIELDERNRTVREAVDRDRKIELDSQDKLASLVEQFNRLMDQQRHAEAEVVAKQARELSPSAEVVQVMLWKSRFVRAYEEQRAIREQSQQGFVDALTSVDRAAIPFDDSIPYRFGNATNWRDLTRRRADLLRERNSRMSEAELEIERQLRTPIDVRFTDRPLSDVMATLGKMANVNVYLDPQGMAAEGVTSDQPVTINLNQPVSLKSALNLILQPLRLSYVIQNEVLRITSEQTRDSNVYPKVYNVADLVIPIPNFVPSYNMGLPGAIAAAHRAVGYGGPIGSQAAAPLTMASNDAHSSINPLALAQVGGSFGSSSARATQSLGPGPGGLGGGPQADFDSLIELITTTISPTTWDEMGGPGSIAPFETNLSLVVSQTQEVHEQIADLLAQLRRLQDLQVTIEVRFITLADNFFERIGIDFDFQIDDNAGGVVNPQGEDDDGPTVVIGLDPTGLPTSDLDLVFGQGSFASTVPTFGGFDPATAANFGFAILSDIEVFFLLQAAQGDQRTNVMQAPKVTLFNGQQAFVSDTAQTPFVTSVIPVVGDFAAAHQPVIVVLSEGTSLSVQAVVSSDRRFVRLTLVPFFSKIGEVKEFTFNGKRSSNTGTVIADPTNDQQNARNNQEDIIEGTTVQLPTFAFTTVTTTVSVPDGGTVLLGGIKRLSEGRNERGVPLLSKIPYVNRLFRNVGIGRETQSLMMMVTPRIIIQEEEEERLGIEVQP